MDKDQQHYLTPVRQDLTRMPADHFPSHYPMPPADQVSYGFVDDGSVNFQKYLRLALRHWKLIAGFTFLGILAAICLTRIQTPIYRAATSLEIQAAGDLSLSTRDRETTNDPDIHTQASLLQGWSLRGRVVNKLESVNSDSASKSPEKTVADDKPEQKRSGNRPPQANVSIWSVVKSLILPQGPSSPVRMAAQTLKVVPAKDSRIIFITCDSTDPGVAADFVNTLVSEFIEQRNEDRWDVYNTTGQLLTRAQEELRLKLEASEEKLQAYAKSSGLLFVGVDRSVAEEKLGQLQVELSHAQADRIQRESKYKLTNLGSTESLPEVLDSGPLAQYQVKLADLRRELALLTSSLTPAHPKVIRLQSQISELESTIASERQNIVKRLKNEYESAQERERLLSRNYSGQTQIVSEQGEKAIQYNLLKKDVEANRQLYQAALQRGKEASINSALRSSNVRVVDGARPSFFPYKPNVLVNLLVGLLGGCFAGIGLILARDHLNRSIRMPGEASCYLNVPELGVIPSSHIESSRPLTRRLQRFLPPSAGSEFGNDLSHQKKPAQTVELITWENKPSLLAESFRATLTSILFSPEQPGARRVLAITSSMPSEGKTTITSNLAIALAETSRRVVLVDADMRRPRLHKVFNTVNTWGLSNLLQEKTLITDYPRETLTRNTTIPNLNLLVSGPGVVGIPSVLQSNRAAQLLERLKREFDVVLIDCPPMLHLADARVLGRLADGVILVIRAGKTSQEAVVSAVHRFSEDGTRVLGTILNDWNPKAAPYTRGYEYDKTYYYTSK
jgi:polysaccharide biosynthesis transport protein